MSSSSSSEGTQLLMFKDHVSDESGEESIKIDEFDNDLEDRGSRNKRCREYSRWSPIEEGVTLAWEDLTVYAKVRKNNTDTYKRIVNGVSGAVKAGSLVALMGASGAGKSTLMTALAHRLSAGMEYDGSVLINGRPIGNYMKYLSGFMHQDDLFIGSLTVMEHMQIMARLKLDRRTTAQDRNNKIRELLKNLGLLKCLHTQIGLVGGSKSLSGGEKKRLSFATELLTDPPILFCDEPTTGLDSYSAQKLVKMMNKMAATGKTILCTIHQPSSDVFAMFSQVILLADGRIAYMGSIANALEFFNNLGYRCPSSYNPSEFFIKTLASTPGYESNSKQMVKNICDRFAVSDYAKETDVVLQYEFHMGRSIEAIAIMVGLCYFGTDPYTQKGIQSVQGAIFMIVTENTFNPMYSVLAEFPDNTPLFLREFKSGLYHPLLYYFSRILSMLPGMIIEPIIYVAICYWLSGLRMTTYAFLMTTLIGTLTMNVSTACGVFFSNAFDSVPSAMAYLVPFDYILMVTSGLFIKLSTLPQLLTWTKYLSWLMYSTEALSIVQWKGVTNITCENQNEDIPCITEGSEVLEKYSFSEQNLTRDMLNMFFLCLIFYVLGYLCMWLKIRKK